ncbi:MAG TPA: sulfotransferase, partial [Burkholderiales bacterium]|nr:sulfotransferase [Burkholderiales bacterium]
MQNDAIIREGIALQREGEFDAAASIYEELLERSPGDARALHYLGLARFQQDRLPEAERLIVESLQREPRNPNAWSDLGMVRVRADAPEQALEPLSKALALAPDHPDALNNMAQALRKLHRYDQALPLLERLVSLKPESAPARYALADTQYKSSDVTNAIANFQKAVRLDPADPRIRIGLGDACESDGRFKQAKMQYLAVLRREPNSPLALAKLLQLREGAVDLQWIERAQALAGDAATPDEGRIRLNVALGYWYDREKRHDEAFRRLKLGYDAQARREPFDADGYTRAIDNLTEVLTAEFFEAAPTSGIDSERPIFVVGMPRSGTTLIEQILASHSKVAGGGELSMLLNVSYQIGELSRSGEPYPRGLRSMGRMGLRQMARRYLDHLDRISPDAPRVTDKLPFNFMHLGVIALLFPKARIVHCRRHPLDNCLSCYFTGFAEQIRFANKLDTLGRYYLDYDRLMRHWHAVLPVPIRDLHYERLVHDTETEVRSLLDFCGLEWEEACLAFHNTRRGVRTPSRWQVRQPIYTESVQRWETYASQLEPLIRILAPILPAEEAVFV